MPGKKRPICKLYIWARVNREIKFQGRKKQNLKSYAIAKFIKIHLNNQNIIANNAKFISPYHGILFIYTYFYETTYVMVLNRVRPVMVRVSKP